MTRCLYLALWLALPSASAAPLLEEVVVTGMRQHSQLGELPYSAYALAQEQLAASRSLPEALAGQPGVLVQKTANGHGSPFIRGFTGYRTLALIDGVRYNNSVYRDGPNEYFGLIDSQSLAGLELFSGPASALYGSDAIGGTLNLRSRRAAFEEQLGHYWQGRQSLYWASAENSLRSRSELELGKGEQWGLLAGLSRKHFGDIKAAKLGTLPTTGYDEYSYDLRLDQRLNRQWSLTALAQQLKQDDVWRSHSTIYAKPFAGTDVGSDRKRLKDQARRFHYLRFNGQGLGSAVSDLQLTLSRQQWREDGLRQKADASGIEEFFDSRMGGLELELGSHWGDARWVYGLDYYRDRIDSGRRDFDPSGALSQIQIQGPVGDDSRFAQLGLYSQLQLALGQRWQLWLGNRYSEVSAHIGRYRDPASGAAASLSKRWHNLSSSLRLQYRPGPGSQFWLGLSQAFRAPNIADLSRFGKSRSNETEIAAPNLQPEKFLTTELAWRFQRGPARLQLTAFYTDIDDYIVSAATGNIRDGLIEVSKANAAAGRVYGIEGQWHWPLGQHWQLEANGSWLKARQTLPGAAEQPFSRSMPLQLGAALVYRRGQSDWRLELNHSAHADQLSAADRQDSQRIPPGGTPAYSVINLRSRHRLNHWLELQFDLSNLGDKAYRSHGSGVNEPGRGLSLGLSARWD